MAKIKNKQRERINASVAFEVIKVIISLHNVNTKGQDSYILSWSIFISFNICLRSKINSMNSSKSSSKA